MVTPWRIQVLSGIDLRPEAPTSEWPRCMGSIEDTKQHWVRCGCLLPTRSYVPVAFRINYGQFGRPMDRRMGALGRPERCVVESTLGVHDFLGLEDLRLLALHVLVFRWNGRVATAL